MGSPCEPLTPRQEMISELESLGYDATTANSAWRENLADQEMRDTVAVLNGDDPSEEPEWPDIQEMVDAIRKATVVLTLTQGLQNASPARRVDIMSERDKTLPSALSACRDILNRIELASAACGPGAQQPEQAQ